MQRPKGLKGFSIMSIAETLSLVGSAMTQFGIGIWIWKTTGNATPFSINSTLFFIPNMLFTPIAGALVDRWPKKRALILPDIASGIITIITLILYKANYLTLSFIYAASFISGIFNTFQWPAYSVTISIMLKKEEYGKANGLFSLTDTAPMIIAPIVAGAILPVIGLAGIMTIDILTFILAIAAVLWVYIPDVRNEVAEKTSLFKDAIFGFSYIARIKPLLYLLVYFLSANFFAGFYTTLMSPMILAKTNNNSLVLGMVQSALGIGGTGGGLIMAAWGGTKKKIYTVIGGGMLFGFGIALMGLSNFLTLYLIAGFTIGVSAIIANSANQAIWQAKVPPELQGRVFSARRVISESISVIPMATSGPIVDKILTPIFERSPRISSIFGQGKGGAISIMSFVAGIMIILVSIVAFLSPQIMNVEDVELEKAEEGEENTNI